MTHGKCTVNWRNKGLYIAIDCNVVFVFFNVFFPSELSYSLMPHLLSYTVHTTYKLWVNNV